MAVTIWADGTTGEILRILRGGEPVDPAEPPAAGAVSLTLEVAAADPLGRELVATPADFRLQGGVLWQRGQPVTPPTMPPTARAQVAAKLAELNPAAATTVPQLRGQLATLVEAVQMLLCE